MQVFMYFLFFGDTLWYHLPDVNKILHIFTPMEKWDKMCLHLRLQPPANSPSLVMYIVPSSRTDFFIDMSGQISSRRWQLSTKQWSGNKCGDVLTKIQTSSYAMDHRDWPGKQLLAEHQAYRCTRLQRLSQTVKPFEGLFYLYFCFLNESFLFQNSTLSCKQNIIFVDMS